MLNESNLIKTDIKEYLKQHENKEIIRFLTCGNVDDGKSTLIGRLLYDSKMIYEDQLESTITQDGVKYSTNDDKIDLALLVDGLQAEREQGITIDVAYRYFSTTKRKFIIADTPGHEQFTRNMATGASTCQLAVILIDACHGVQTQTRRHSYIASLLGIKHIVVAINKMDIHDYKETIYNDIREDYSRFANKLGIDNIDFIPLSALFGDNVVNKSKNMPWYRGKTFISLLDTIELTSDTDIESIRFPVQFVNRPNPNFRGYCGTVASGTIKIGDQISILPSGRKSRIKGILTYDGEQCEAISGEAITVTLKDEIDISRGDMIVGHKNQPYVANKFKAIVVWMTEHKLIANKQYSFKVGVRNSTGILTTILYQINVNTLAKDLVTELSINEIGLCEFALNAPVIFDYYNNNRNTGSFIIIDRITNITIGAGMITERISESSKQSIDDKLLSKFEIEFNSLTRKYFPHWEAKDLSKLLK